MGTTTKAIVASLNYSADETRTYNVFGPSQTGSNNVMNVSISNGRATDRVSETDDEIKKIPVEGKSFIKRENYFDDLCSATEDNGFVVLHGTPCVGKTSLATNFVNRTKSKYNNIIWIDMREINVAGAIGEIYERMLLELNVDTRSLDLKFFKRDLETHLRSLESRKKTTLFILDNMETFLSIKDDENTDPPIKGLFSLLEKNSPTYTKVIAISRCPADQHFFGANIKNFEIKPFEDDLSEVYLNRLLKRQNQDSIDQEVVDLLKERCFGSPLLMEIFSKQIIAASSYDRKCILQKIKENPLKAAKELSPYYKRMISISLNLLSEEEKNAANLLCIFPSTIPLLLAERLFQKREIDNRLIFQLIAKGIIIKRNEMNELSMHPFLQEHCQEKCKSERQRNLMCLLNIYLETFFEKSKESFKCDMSGEIVKEFNRLMSSFEHMVNILRDRNKKESCGSSIINFIDRQNFSSFFLFLKFLWYQVSKKKIEDIFNFLLENTGSKEMIKICLNELKWIVPCYWEQQDKSEDCKGVDGYEFVVYERIRLSKEVYDDFVKGFKYKQTETLKGKLEKLLESVENLENHKLKAYYLIKVKKLLAKVYHSKKDFAKAESYLEECLDVSKKAFGVSFWTVDCFVELIKISMKQKDNSKVKQYLDSAFEMGHKGGFTDHHKFSNVLVIKMRFLHSISDEENLHEIRELGEKVIRLSLSGGTKLLCQSLKSMIISDKSYIEEAMDIFKKVKTPDENFVEMVDETSRMYTWYKYNIDKNFLQDRLRTGVDILQRSIALLQNTIERQEFSQEFDGPSINNALFRWNMELAMRHGDVLQQSQRKVHAHEALNIANLEKLENHVEDKLVLEQIAEQDYSLEEEKLILQATFLDNFFSCMPKWAKKRKEGKK
ncbi:uncharacterized protein LOC135682837 [Rhopilema esculentum]|uniref:uncharacterized protein LOC135682837 n=1 Tax=Rhopilema esculentum TaxID=499914 RepID=UPI0031DA69C5